MQRRDSRYLCAPRRSAHCSLKLDKLPAAYEIYLQDIEISQTHDRFTKPRVYFYCDGAPLTPRCHSAPSGPVAFNASTAWPNAARARVTCQARVRMQVTGGAPPAWAT